MEENKRFTLGKINIILIAVGFAIIVLGFILMTGSTTTPGNFSWVKRPYKTM